MSENVNYNFILKCTDSANLELVNLLHPNVSNHWLQSFCYIEKENALVACYANLDINQNSVIMQKINLSNFSVIKQVNNLPYYHCNDITYNPKTNKLYITPMKSPGEIPLNKVYELNASTFQKEKEYSIGTNNGQMASGIAYDSINDRYYAVINGITILDNNFNIIKSFPLSYTINLKTHQMIEFYDNKVFVGYDNKIVIYDSDGNYLKHFTTLGKQETEGFTHIGNGNFLIGKMLDSPSNTAQLYKFNIFDNHEENKWSFYTDVNQIGLKFDSSLTLEKICDYMPNNSIIQFDTNRPACTTLIQQLPNMYGNLLIRKINFARILMQFSYETNQKLKYYICKYRYDYPGINWREVMFSDVAETKPIAQNGAKIMDSRIKKVGNIVECNIRLQGITKVGNIVVAKIPEGFRPNFYKRVIGACSGNNYARFEISKNGEVLIYATTLNTISSDYWFELITSYIVDN